jgi:hypothetical protein
MRFGPQRIAAIGQPASMQALGLPRRSAAAPPAVAPTLTYKGNNTDGTAATSYSFAGCDIGTASADRVVVVAAFGNSGGTSIVNGVTIGGIAASPIVTSVAGTRFLDLWFAVVPTGTTATIAFTTSTNLARGSVAWWTINGSTQTTYAARSGANPNTAGSATSRSITSITVGAAQVALAVAMNADSTGDDISWTQSSGSGTRDFEGAFGTSTRASGYQTNAVGAQVFTPSGGLSAWRAAAFTWGA